MNSSKKYILLKSQITEISILQTCRTSIRKRCKSHMSRTLATKIFLGPKLT